MTISHQLSDYLLSVVINKGSDHLDWEEFCMAMVMLHMRYGGEQNADNAAVILNENKQIICMAHNGLLNGKVNHAELRAVQEVPKGVGNTIFTISFPCKKCAESIVAAGISKVIYLCEHSKDSNASEIFDRHGVAYSKFTSCKEEVIIDFAKMSDPVNDSC